MKHFWGLSVLIAALSGCGGGGGGGSDGSNLAGGMQGIDIRWSSVEQWVAWTM